MSTQQGWNYAQFIRWLLRRAGYINGADEWMVDISRFVVRNRRQRAAMERVKRLGGEYVLLKALDTGVWPKLPRDLGASECKQKKSHKEKRSRKQHAARERKRQAKAAGSATSPFVKSGPTFGFGAW